MKSATGLEELTSLTELLALNTLIESARMGKDGAKFANIATGLKDLSKDTLKLLQQKSNSRDYDIEQTSTAIENAIQQKLVVMQDVFDSLNNLNLTEKKQDNSQIRNREDLQRLGDTLNQDLGQTLKQNTNMNSDSVN